MILSQMTVHLKNSHSNSSLENQQSQKRTVLKTYIKESNSNTADGLISTFFE